MKSLHKNLLGIALSTSMCLFLAFPAGAQHREPNNSGSSSSGSSSAPRSSAPPSGGSFSPRPSAPSPQPSSSYSPRSSSQPSNSGYTPRQSQPGNSGYAPRPSQPGNSGYTPRPSGSGYQPPQRVGVAPGSPGQQRAGYVPQRGQGQQQNGYYPRQGQRNNAYGITTPGANPRPYVGGQRVSNGNGYRSYPGTGFERGRESWRNRGYYHYNRGYYGTYYRPRLGFSIGILPAGYYPFSYDDYDYYYSGGLYYQYTNNEYTVVEPPIGAEITTLPEKAQAITINGQQFYELNGVYYQPVTKDDGTVVYMIAGKDGELNTDSLSEDTDQGPQIGDIVNELPQDCRKIKVNGEKLYVSPDGIYYQELKDANGNKTYKIVGLPSDEGDQN